MRQRKRHVDRVVLGVLFLLSLYALVIWSILKTRMQHHIHRPQVTIVETAPVIVPPIEQASPAPAPPAEEITAKPSGDNDLPGDSKPQEITPELRGAIDLPEVPSDPAAVEPGADDQGAERAAVQPAGADVRHPRHRRGRGRHHHRHGRAAPPIAFPAWMTPGTFE